MAPEPNLSRDVIVGALGDVWAQIAAIGHDLTEADWDLPSRCPGWSARDLVSHILGTELMLAGRPQPSVEVGEAEHLSNDIARFNEAWVAERRTRPGREVLAEFEAITAERLAALERMTQEQFDEEAWTPAGHATYGRFMQIRVFDSWMHEQDLRDAVGRPGGLEGPAVTVALAEISLALGYVVGKKAAVPAGSSVALVVSGPRRHRFDVVVDERARLSDQPVLSPTATVTTDLATFVALVGGRIEPGPAIADGRVTMSGDPAIADRVAHNLSFVI